MDLKSVKARMNRLVYYDTGQLNLENRSVHEFIMTACILRKDKKNRFYYEAELKDTDSRNVIIVPLEEILLRNE